MPAAPCFFGWNLADISYPPHHPPHLWCVRHHPTSGIAVPNANAACLSDPQSCEGVARGACPRVASAGAGDRCSPCGCVRPFSDFSPALRAAPGSWLRRPARAADQGQLARHHASISGVEDSNRPVFPKYFFASPSRGAGSSATSMNPHVRCMLTIGNDGNLSLFRAIDSNCRRGSRDCQVPTDERGREESAGNAGMVGPATGRNSDAIIGQNYFRRSPDVHHSSGDGGNRPRTLHDLPADSRRATADPQSRSPSPHRREVAIGACWR
jgi:hypothetical protein